MKWVFIFLLPIFIFSCNANSSSDDAKNESSPDNHKSKDTSVAVSNDGDNNLSGCYWKVLQRDTFVLHLAASGNDLSGKLTFNNFEKDKSSGIVRGKIEGDILNMVQFSIRRHAKLDGSVLQKTRGSPHKRVGTGYSKRRQCLLQQ